MTTNKGHPQLPDHYQVNPPKGNIVEVAELLKKGGFGSHFSGDSNWYEIEFKFAQSNNKEKPNVPVIEYSVWKNAILGFTGTPAEIAKAQPVQEDYSISAIKDKKVSIHCSTQEEYDDVRNIIPDCRLQSSYWGENYKDQTIIQVDKYECSYGNLAWAKANGYQVITASQFLAANSLPAMKKDKYIVGSYVMVRYLDGNGISTGGTAELLAKVLNPTAKCTGKHATTPDTIVVETFAGYYPGNYRVQLKACRPATLEEISRAQYPVQEEGWKVGDQFQHGGKGTVYTISPSKGIHKCYYVKWMNDTVVNETSYTKEQIDEFWDKLWIPCKSQPVEANIPVTVDNVYIGMKVVATKAFLQQYTSLNNDANGIIISLATSGIPKMCVRFKHNTLYVAYSELTVAPQDTKEVNSSTINQLLTNKQKPKTEYETTTEYNSTVIRFKTHLRADFTSVTSTEGGESYSAKCKVQPKIVEGQHRKDQGCIGYSHRQKGQYPG